MTNIQVSVFAALIVLIPIASITWAEELSPTAEEHSLHPAPIVGDENGPSPTPEAENRRDSGTIVMVEMDPIPFVLSGHAAHWRLANQRFPGWVLTLGTYGLEIPGFLTDINSKNNDEGWNVEIRNAYAFFADYHFSGRPEGLFVGSQLAYQRFGITRDPSDDKREFGVLLAMARVGTLWKPFDSGFYILPWAGIGANIQVDNNNLTLAGEEYNVAPIAGFVTLHVGWQLSPGL